MFKTLTSIRLASDFHFVLLVEVMYVFVFKPGTPGYKASGLTTTPWQLLYLRLNKIIKTGFLLSWLN